MGLYLARIEWWILMPVGLWWPWGTYLTVLIIYSVLVWLLPRSRWQRWLAQAAVVSGPVVIVVGVAIILLGALSRGGAAEVEESPPLFLAGWLTVASGLCGFLFSAALLAEVGLSKQDFESNARDVRPHLPRRLLAPAFFLLFAIGLTYAGFILVLRQGSADLRRPASVRFLVLIDRGHRELPLTADIVGRYVPTTAREEVRVRLSEIDGEEGVWLVETEASEE
jgi:hypothetical protein